MRNYRVTHSSQDCNNRKEASAYVYPVYYKNVVRLYYRDNGLRKNSLRNK